MRRRVGMVAVTLGLVALLSACAVETQISPQPIGKDDVPFGLLKNSQTAPVPPVETVLVTIYFEGGQHLVTVNRAVPAPPTLKGVLKALGQGPTSAESAANVESPISTVTPLTLKYVQGGAAVVDIAASFSALSGHDQIAAAAQLVYTLTEFPGIEAVLIRVGGQAAQVPTATGRVHTGRLDRAAYAELAPL